MEVNQMDLLKINGKKIERLKTYDVQYNKLWADDSGRTMDGRMSGTLIGIFPKILLEFGPMSDSEISALLKVINRPVMSVTYYDPEYKGLRTADYYSNDPTASLKKLSTMRHKGFTLNLIPMEKR